MKRYLSIPMLLLTLAVVVSVASAAPLAAIAVPNPGSASSVIVIQNTNATNSAQWVLDFIDQNGNAVAGAQQTGTLPAYVATAVNVSNITVLGTGWNGSAIVSSDQQVAAVGATTWTGGTVGDGTTAGEYLAFSGGAASITFPYVFNSNRVTWLTVQNTGSSAATAYFTFIDRRTGTQTGSRTSVSIPAGAQRTYRMNDCSTGIVPAGACTRPNTNDEAQYWKGAVVVTSTNPVLAGVAVTHWPEWSADYVSVSPAESANELIFPLFFRVRTSGGVFGETQPWHRYSDMTIANPDLTASVVITVELFNSSTGARDDWWTVSIPPGSAVGINTRYAGNGNPADWATRWPVLLGANWIGTAVVTAQPGRQVQGVNFNFWPQSSQNYVGGYNAVIRDAGAQRLFFPVAYRSGGSTIPLYSHIQVQNTANAPTTIDVYFFNRNQANGGIGNAFYALTTGLVIQPNSSIILNTKYNSTGVPNNWFTGLGTSFNGSVVVISRNNPITGIVYNLNHNPRRASSYNGLPLD
jgi:hypothetical protein